MTEADSDLNLDLTNSTNLAGQPALTCVLGVWTSRPQHLKSKHFIHRTVSLGQLGYLLSYNLYSQDYWVGTPWGGTPGLSSAHSPPDLFWRTSQLSFLQTLLKPEISLGEFNTHRTRVLTMLLASQDALELRREWQYLAAPEFVAKDPLFSRHTFCSTHPQGMHWGKTLRVMRLCGVRCLPSMKCSRKRIDSVRTVCYWGA